MVHIFAPEQHDLYDGHFVISANRIYMVGGLNDREGWDHLDNDAKERPPRLGHGRHRRQAGEHRFPGIREKHMRSVRSALVIAATAPGICSLRCVRFDDEVSMAVGRRCGRRRIAGPKGV